MDDKLLNATDVEFQTSGTDRPDRRRRRRRRIDEGEIYKPSMPDTGIPQKFVLAALLRVENIRYFFPRLLHV